MILQIIDIATAIAIIAGTTVIIVCCFLKDNQKYKERNNK